MRRIGSVITNYLCSVGIPPSSLEERTFKLVTNGVHNTAFISRNVKPQALFLGGLEAGLSGIGEPYTDLNTTLPDVLSFEAIPGRVLTLPWVFVPDGVNNLVLPWVMR